MKSISGKRLCEILVKRGWQLIRVQSSHFIYVHPDRPDGLVSVPVHGNKDLGKGLQRTLMKQAGLIDADL